MAERLIEIIDALQGKGVNSPCPRCEAKKFNVVGESEISVKKTRGALRGLSSDTKVTIPTIIVACDNCGFISQHAQSVLGIEKSRGILGRARSNDW